MSEAELIAVYDKAKDPRSRGRRFMDKVAYGMLDVVKIIKLAGMIVKELSTFFLAAVGAGMLGYNAWQDFKGQLARDKPPPAMVKRVHSD